MSEARQRQRVALSRHDVHPCSPCVIDGAVHGRAIVCLLVSVSKAHAGVEVAFPRRWSWLMLVCDRRLRCFALLVVRGRSRSASMGNELEPLSGNLRADGYGGVGGHGGFSRPPRPVP